MNEMKKLVVCACIGITMMFAATASRAESPFDGTWRADLSQTKFSPKPLSFYISQGWYHCTGSCNPAYDVAADGQDHPVSGHAYDSLSVTIVDAHTITVVGKKDGKTMYEQTRAVSADGKTLTVKSTEHPMNSDQTNTFETVAKRSGVASSGVHATSGNWILQKQSGSGNALLTTYKTNGDEFDMSDPTGVSYSAKLDDTDYPVKGAYGWTSVSLKKINANSIEETDKRDSTVTDVTTMTVASNGKTMTIVDTDKLTGRVDTFVAVKQK